MTEGLQRRRPRELRDLATSLEAARHDQVLILDRRGEVIGEKGLARQLNKLIIPASLAVGVAGGFLGLNVLAVAAGGALLIGGPLLWLSLRWRPLRVAWAQAASGQLGEARATLEALARRPPWRGRPIVEVELGRVSLLQGRTKEAIQHYDRATSELATRRGHRNSPMYWLGRIGRGSALAILGDAESARAVYDELEEAPASPLFDLGRQYIQLRIAFTTGDASPLDDDVLYDWARSSLAINVSGTNLALLAWAFDGLGDREMARHLLAETPERLEGHFLESSDPALLAFVQTAWADWGLESERGALEIPR